MPIKHFKGGNTVTGDSMNYFILCAQRGAVGLEMKGIKVRRGLVLWKQLRDHYHIPAPPGVTRQANAHDVFNWLDAKVKELRPQQEHIVEENGRQIRMVNGQEVQ